MRQKIYEDILGAILDVFETKGSPSDKLLVVRDDGFITQIPLHSWIKPLPIIGMDLTALQNLQPGTALDIGCGTGRHLKWLVDNAIKPYGIDISEGAIKRARRIDGALASAVSVWDYQPSEGFNNIIIMGNTIGLIGQLDTLSPFLKRLSGWCARDAQVLITGFDWRSPKAGPHYDYQKHNQRPYRGETSLQLQYQDIVGPPFNWLWLDPDTLLERARFMGFEAEEIIQEGAQYILSLRKISD